MEFATRTIHAGQPSEPGAQAVGHARGLYPGCEHNQDLIADVLEGLAALDGIREGELATLAV
jgi:hypothetical protein